MPHTQNYMIVIYQLSEYIIPLPAVQVGINDKNSADFNAVKCLLECCCYQNLLHIIVQMPANDFS